METRPVSMTLISALLVVFTLFGLYGVITVNSNPITATALQQMQIPLALYQTWGILRAILNFACAYGILKGLPWARVLYLVWGPIAVLISVYISPIKLVVVFGLVVVVIICAFLWTNIANDWFQARGLMLKRETSR